MSSFLVRSGGSTELLVFEHVALGHVLDDLVLDQRIAKFDRLDFSATELQICDHRNSLFAREASCVCVCVCVCDDGQATRRTRIPLFVGGQVVFPVLDYELLLQSLGLGFEQLQLIRGSHTDLVFPATHV